MANVELHPQSDELKAFMLGTLDDEESDLLIEQHLADCPTCQEAAAVVPDDTLVELIRRVRARPAVLMETLTEALGQAVTPDTLPPTQAEGPMPVPPEPAEVPVELVSHPRYRVRRLIGVGGMGAVYEAEHLVMERPVAIKVINRAFTANAAAVERFRREVRAAAHLAHPNIVTAHDAEHAGDTLFLVTEYVEGISLGRLVRERGPLPIAEACDYIRQAALGLQHAHKRGMVHRDIKPENLIVTHQSPDQKGAETASPHDGNEPDRAVVKVLDFGLAVLTVERGDGLTAEHAIMGTPEYMAPEQAENSHTADIRADIYSLGCTLYVLLTGNVPYPAETPLLKILAHRERPLPSIRKARPDVPPELAAVLARMMAKKPQDRYQTPAEVAAALAPFVGQVSNLPSQPASWQLAPRNRRLLLAASLLAALLLAGGVVYRIQTDKGELVITTESDDVEVVIKQSGEQIDIIDTKTKKSIRLRSGEYDLELKDAPGLKLDLEKVTLKRGKETVATIEKIAKPQPAGQQASQWTVADLPKKIGLIRSMPVRWTNGYGPFISSDGRLFAIPVVTSEHVQPFHPENYRIHETVTGRLRMTVAGRVFSGGIFLRGGKELLCSDELRRHTCAFQVWDLESAQDHYLDLKLAGDWPIALNLSPDGKRLAFTLCSGTAPNTEATRVIDLDSGKILLDTHDQLDGPPPEGGRTCFAAEGKLAVTTRNRGSKGLIRIDDLAHHVGTKSFDTQALQFPSVDPGSGLLMAQFGDDWSQMGLWNLNTGKMVRSFALRDPKSPGWVGNRGSLTIPVRQDNRVRVLEMSSGKEIWSIESLADTGGISEDGRVLWLIVGTEYQFYRLPDMPAANDKP
jgi:serine/threonine protein kinase